MVSKHKDHSSGIIRSADHPAVKPVNEEAIRSDFQLRGYAKEQEESENGAEDELNSPPGGIAGCGEQLPIKPLSTVSQESIECVSSASLDIELQAFDSEGQFNKQFEQTLCVRNQDGTSL